MALAVFDLDDTVWSRADALKRWAELVPSAGEKALDKTEVVLGADASGSADRRNFLKTVHRELLVPMSLEALEVWYEDSYPKCFRPFAGVERALQQMHAAGWAMGVVTNGTGARQKKKLHATGLDHFFGSIVASDEAGVRKPDASIFAMVAAELGHELDGWAFGDSAEEDICGARSAGLRTAWVGDHNSWPGRFAPPDLIATTLAELVAVVLTQP